MSDEPWRLSVFGDEVAIDLEEQCAALRAREIPGVELRSAWGVNVSDFDAAQLERAAAVLRDTGIEVSAIGSPLGKVPAEEDPAAEVDRVRRSFDAAVRLGTRQVRVFSYFVEGRYAELRDTVLRRVAALAREAERRELLLVMENESYLYGDLPERCLDVLETVGSPALRFAFDPANFVQCGIRPIVEAWPRLRPFTVHVHIKDAVAVDRSGLPPYPAEVPGERLMSSVRPAGEGEGGIRELLQALRADDYGGRLTLEPHLAGRYPDLDGPGRLDVAVGALRRLLGEVRSGTAGQ
ncbi:MAG: sugar phosphate isomerase/epimerase family protein [Candidatus Dormiibacterota bacterium]